MYTIYYYMEVFIIKNKFFLIIAGSRDFFDYDFLYKKCDYLLQNHKDKEIIIVGGLASGADTLGELYSIDRGYKFLPYPANWDKYKKFAGHLRNQEMANCIKDKDYKGCICFWDGISKGTYDMINICKNDNIPIRVCKYVKETENELTTIKRSKSNKIYCTFKNENLNEKQKKLKINLKRLNISCFNQ